MTATETKKFRSSFHGIDLKLLRMLCDLHPWSMTDLCRSVGMEPAVLSMVLAGKRPLPSRVARSFLALMGMNEDGTLDSSHGFIFKEKPGRESELKHVYDLLFAETPAICRLTINVPDTGNQGRPPTIKTGFALFQGKFLAILHTDPASTRLVNSEHVFARYLEAPETLLSITALPAKIDILRAFAGSKIEIAPTWDEVIQDAKRRNVEPRDVREWLVANFSAPETEKNCPR